MANLKKQQRKMLTQQIASRVMESLLGVNEKNEPALSKLIKKSSRGIANAYYDVMKKQYKKIIKSMELKEEPAQTIIEKTTTLNAS